MDGRTMRLRRHHLRLLVLWMTLLLRWPSLLASYLISVIHPLLFLSLWMWNHGLGRRLDQRSHAGNMLWRCAT